MNFTNATDYELLCYLKENNIAPSRQNLKIFKEGLNSHQKDLVSKYKVVSPDDVDRVNAPLADIMKIRQHMYGRKASADINKSDTFSTSSDILRGKSAKAYNNAMYQKDPVKLADGVKQSEHLTKAADLMDKTKKTMDEITSSSDFYDAAGKIKKAKEKVSAKSNPTPKGNTTSKDMYAHGGVLTKAQTNRAS
jgi:hypothetical protein